MMADHHHHQQQQQQQQQPSSASEPRRGLSLSVSNHQSSQASASSPSRSARSNKPILSPAGRPCLICFDKERDGVECELGHFVCRGCLRGFIANLEPLQVRAYLLLGGGVGRVDAPACDPHRSNGLCVETA